MLLQCCIKNGGLRRNIWTLKLLLGNVREALWKPIYAFTYTCLGDSDEETDYSKMDMGNKKGPVGRLVFK